MRRCQACTVIAIAAAQALVPSTDTNKKRPDWGVFYWPAPVYTTDVSGRDIAAHPQHDILQGRNTAALSANTPVLKFNQQLIA